VGTDTLAPRAPHPQTGELCSLTCLYSPAFITSVAANFQLLFELEMWERMERVGKKILMNENFFL